MNKIEYYTEFIMDAIDDQIENAKMLERFIPDEYKSLKHHRDEVQTLKFYFPRRTGKTTICMNLLKRLDKALLICGSPNGYRCILNEFKPSDELKERIYRLNDSRMLPEMKTLIIDDATFADKEMLKLLYGGLPPVKTIVLIG